METSADRRVFEPLAKVVGCEVEDIVAAVRDDSDQAIVLYTTDFGKPWSKGWRALIKIDDEEQTLELVDTVEVPELMERIDAMFNGGGA